VLTPQDWAPYAGLEDAARVYLRDPVIALDQLRGVVNQREVQAFIMSRKTTNESWGEALLQEVVLTDGKRLIIWRASDELSSGAEPRPLLGASVRTILLSSITDQIISTEFEILSDGTRRLSEVSLRFYTQLITRSVRKSATDTDLCCESFRFSKSVNDAGLAQIERLIQFGRVLSGSMRPTPAPQALPQSTTTGEGS
jgi:hypothetical protein